tara:strand:- start:6189 stop:6944 length:756 start_codon:yes stop_codon:yes gene_type:complete
MICPRLFYDTSIKLQGIPYYVDCYNFWDLNHCAESFQSKGYVELIDKVISGNQRPWNENLMVVDFSEYDRQYEKYEKALSTNVRRDISQCGKKGFIFKQYDFNSFVQDFSEINYSQKEFKGNINPWYLNGVDFFTGSHSGCKHEWEDNRHYGEWYGLFRYLKHYRQGDIETNEKLYAYCKVLVDGEMASVGLIFAHAKHLKYGLMFNLITSIIKRLIKNEDIKYLVYSGAGQYPAWKNRMLFKPMKIKVQP